MSSKKRSGLARRLGPGPRAGRPGRAAPRSASIADLVTRLGRARSGFGAAERATRRSLLAALAGRSIRDPDLLRRYHDALCFMRAYPDGPATLSAVESALAAIPARVAALRRPASLDETGIAGTTVYCP